MNDLRPMYWEREDREQIDPTRIALEQIPNDFDEVWLETAIYEHEKGLEIVSRDITDRVMGNITGFGSHFFLFLTLSIRPFNDIFHVLI